MGINLEFLNRSLAVSALGLYGWLSKLWSLFGYPGTLNIRGRIIIGTQKGTIILTTSHVWHEILFASQRRRPARGRPVLLGLPGLPRLGGLLAIRV